MRIQRRQPLVSLEFAKEQYDVLQLISLVGVCMGLVYTIYENSGRLQGERASSFFPVIGLTKFEQKSAVHQPHEGREREGEGERDLSLKYKRIAVLDTQRLERVLDNKSDNSYKTETEATTPSALSLKEEIAKLKSELDLRITQAKRKLQRMQAEKNAEIQLLKSSAEKSRKETGGDVGVLEADVRELGMLASWRQMRGVGPDDISLALQIRLQDACMQSKCDIVRPNTSDSDTFTQAPSRPQQCHESTSRLAVVYVRTGSTIASVRVDQLETPTRRQRRMQRCIIAVVNLGIFFRGFIRSMYDRMVVHGNIPRSIFFIWRSINFFH
jgi:hypothetical protein